MLTEPVARYPPHGRLNPKHQRTNRRAHHAGYEWAKRADDFEHRQRVGGLRWRGGELERLLDAGHAAMHEEIARLFAATDGWVAVPEVSFSIFGERGVIDILAWHEPTRSLLVIELKTEIVDVNELMGTIDRKRRLAPTIARERGWIPSSVCVWVIVADSSTNRRRVRAHRTTLRAAFPTDGKTINGWLAGPGAPIACLSFWSNSPASRVKSDLATRKRVRRPARGPAERGSSAQRHPWP